MNKIFSSLACLFMAGLMLTSCSDVEIPEAVESTHVSNLAAAVEGRNVTLSWENPADASGLSIYRNNEQLINADSLFSTYLDRHVPVNQDLLYTVKAKYADGRVSEGETTSLNVAYEAHAKPAMLITANTIDAIPDDDEKAAAEWFRDNVQNGVILTPNDVDQLFPDEYSVIWIQIDRVGIDMGWQNLPSNMITDKIIAALTQYVKDGGNLYLTKHATQLIVPIGRLTEQFGPHLFSSGAGGQGSDNWTVNANIGCDQDEPYDHRKHAIYAGMETNMDFGHESYGLEGPGFREDHNCMWDLNSYGLPDIVPDAGNVVKAFEELEHCTVLGTWGHVSDYCCGGIIEFNPTGDYAGRIIANGLNAYEWDENGTENRYQKNIELLTKNTLDYLSK